MAEDYTSHIKKPMLSLCIYLVLEWYTSSQMLWQLHCLVNVKWLNIYAESQSVGHSQIPDQLLDRRSFFMAILENNDVILLVSWAHVSNGIPQFETSALYLCLSVSHHMGQKLLSYKIWYFHQLSEQTKLLTYYSKII